ncbi:MAG: hypothetical protein LBS80_03075, partial [Tannerella sp.]|nr:hypothetical protein [Tannerella sp.]
MRNETNYQFLQVYENLVIAHPPVRALIEEKFQAFMLLHYQEKSLLDIQRGSPLTEHIEETD